MILKSLLECLPCLLKNKACNPPKSGGEKESV